MKNQVLLSFLQVNDLRKLVVNKDRIGDYQKYLDNNQLSDSKANIIQFISKNIELNPYHKAVADLKDDTSVYADDWLDGVNNTYCCIM